MTFLETTTTLARAAETSVPAAKVHGAGAGDAAPGAAASPDSAARASAAGANPSLYARVLADKANLGAIRPEVRRTGKAGGEAFPASRYADARGVTAADVRAHSAQSFLDAAAHHERLAGRFADERGAAEAELAQLAKLDAGADAAKIEAIARKHGVEPGPGVDAKAATIARLGSLESLAAENAATATASAKAFTTYAGLRRSWMGAALRRVPFQSGLGALNTVMLLASLPSLVGVAASLIPKGHGGAQSADGSSSSEPQSVQARSLIRQQARKDAAAAQAPPSYADAAPSPYATPSPYAVPSPYGSPYGDPYARGLGV